jgi:hypothetical protein
VNHALSIDALKEYNPNDDTFWRFVNRHLSPPTCRLRICPMRDAVRCTQIRAMIALSSDTTGMSASDDEQFRTTADRHYTPYSVLRLASRHSALNFKNWA